MLLGKHDKIVSCYVPFSTKGSYDLFCFVFVVGRDFSECIWFVRNKFCQTEAIFGILLSVIWLLWLLKLLQGLDVVIHIKVVFNCVQGGWKFTFVVFCTFIEHISCAKRWTCCAEDKSSELEFSNGVLYHPNEMNGRLIFLSHGNLHEHSFDVWQNSNRVFSESQQNSN